MTIRLLADREPYTSYAEKGDPKGSFFLCRDGEAEADLEVMPAESFIALDPVEAPELPVFAYGGVSLMAAAFAAGCRDYLREPWSLAELRARAERYDRLHFLAGSKAFELHERSLCLRAEPSQELELNETECKLLRILLRNAGTIVTRRALAMELWRQERGSSRAIDVDIGRLRARLDDLVPGSGDCIKACRGLGYRIDSDICG